ncbi:cytochrome P450 [Pluteus cervinus]|uniref:Cytochrome P450 n=1 Tax=Pluteus cervinus TaxID=181527 RepID=A0ACD3B330_9AGAR|nr:cytochrome P450 [Pluteus cervinus]
MGVMESLLANWTSVLAAFAIVFIISKVNRFVNGLKAVNYLPGPRAPFGPVSLPGLMLPTSWWNPGLFYVWKWRHHYYKAKGSETVGFVSWLSGRPAIITSNLEVAKQVTLGGHKSSWGKPIQEKGGIVLFGMNLVAAEGEVWRKHRRIVGPTFTNDLYQLVWQKTYHTYHEMIEVEGWSKKDTVSVSAVQSLTFKLALLIIGNCGFGFNFHWHEPPTAPDGSMSIQEALSTVTSWNTLDLFFPKWFTKLPVPQFKRYNTAYDKLMDFMRVQVSERRGLVRGGTQLRNDVFTMLVKANEDEESRFRLDDSELIGNVFVLLLAGHETTAHTLGATLGLLAIHEVIQDEVYEEIMSVVGNRAPELSDFAQLEKVTSVFIEALRMFPTAFIVVREAFEDTVLRLPNPLGQEGTTNLPVQKGTQMIVDMIGIQNNPRYFDVNKKFEPRRWWGVSKDSEETFSAFGVGPRACIGRKFATLEAVCFLTCLLRDWKIEPSMKEGETKREWQARVLDARFTITMGVKDVPVRFVRRK